MAQQARQPVQGAAEVLVLSDVTQPALQEAVVESLVAVVVELIEAVEVL
jgi:hypothetical protein